MKSVVVKKSKFSLKSSSRGKCALKKFSDKLPKVSLLRIVMAFKSIPIF